MKTVKPASTTLRANRSTSAEMPGTSCITITGGPLPFRKTARLRPPKANGIATKSASSSIRGLTHQRCACGMASLPLPSTASAPVSSYDFHERSALPLRASKADRPLPARSDRLKTPSRMSAWVESGHSAFHQISNRPTTRRRPRLTWPGTGVRAAGRQRRRVRCPASS